jgi:ABC-type polysaccharide/polyol phosphate transport system ATPase subunit
MSRKRFREVMTGKNDKILSERMRKIMEFAELNWAQLDKVEKKFLKTHDGEVWHKLTEKN